MPVRASSPTENEELKARATPVLEDERARARSSRRLSGADVFGAAAVLVVVAVGFFPVLFGGKTLSTAATALGVNGTSPFEGSPSIPIDNFHLDRGASAWQFEPWVEVNHHEFVAGRVPLWNPYQGAGAPHAANMQSAPFDPLLIPVNLHPTPRTWDLTVIAAFAFGALATYLLARIIGLAALAAFVAAAGVGLSGYFLLYSNNHFSRSFVYIPVLFLAIELVLRYRDRAWPVMVLAVATAGNLLLGMPEASVAVIGTSGVYALLRLCLARSELSVLRVFLRLGVGLLAGFALAAPLLLLMLDYLGHSVSRHSLEHRVGQYADPVRMMLSWVVPFFNGEPWSTSLADGHSGVRNWIGGAGATLAIVGFAVRDRQTRVYRLAFSLLALVLIVKVYDFGILTWVGRIPILNITNFAFVMPAVLGFALAMLAGLGIQGLLDGHVERRRLFIGLSIATILALWIITMDKNREYIRATTGTLALGQFGVAIAGVLIVGIAVLLVRSPRGAAGVAAGTVVLELMLLASHAVYADRADPFKEPVWVKTLKADLAAHPYARVVGLDGKLFPNTAAALGLYDIRVLDALNVDRYMDYVKTFLQPSVLDRFVGGPYATHERRFTRYLDNPMFDALGVRYMISTSPVTSVGATPLLFQTLRFVVPDDALRRHVIDVNGDTRVVLFEHPDRDVALPAAPPERNRLAFDYTVDPVAFSDAGHDGVRFEVVAADAEGAEQTLWSDDFVPRTDPMAPEWRHAEVPLSFDGKPVTSVSLRTRARGNTATDWAGWSGLEYLAAADAPRTGRPDDDDAFRLLTIEGDTRVYEYRRTLPRAWVVHDARVVSDRDEVTPLLAETGWSDAEGAVFAGGFDPRREVILEEDSPGALRLSREEGCRRENGPEGASITKYRADRVELQVTASCPGYLVLSDTYFPGWKASVNGDRAEIFPANLAMRAVAVPVGNSTIVFSYRPGAFPRGLVLAVLALIGGLGGIAYQDVWKLKRAVPRA